MELKFPYAITIGIPVIILLAILTYGVRKKFKKGRKVANTEFIENIEHGFQRCSYRFFVDRLIQINGIFSVVQQISRGKRQIM